MSALLLAVLVQFPTDVFDNVAPFEPLESRDGVVTSKRQVKGSPYAEYRVERFTPFTAEQLCVAVFEWGTRHGDGPGVTLNTVLTDGDDVRVIYNHLSKPVIANRDYALTIARERLPDGSCRLRFRTTNEAAPPSPAGYVRIEKLWGEWRFMPVVSGGASLTYTLFSDPAGSVPPFLVHGPARQATFDAAAMAVEKTKRFVEGRQ